MTLGVRLKRSHMIDGGWLEGNDRSTGVIIGHCSVLDVYTPLQTHMLNTNPQVMVLGGGAFSR